MAVRGDAAPNRPPARIREPAATRPTIDRQPPGRGRRLKWWIARRYLSSRRWRGFVSLITLIAIGGVAVGVMALIVVIGVMSGLQKDLREKILGASAHGLVLEVGQQARMDAWPLVLDRVREDPDVTAAAPFIYTEVGLNAGGGFSTGAVLRGLHNDSLSLGVTQIGDFIVSGGMPFEPTESGRPGILVGEGLAGTLGLYPGKLVTVVSFQNAELTSAGFVMPQLRRFEVTGIFRTGLYQYDTKFTYVGLVEAQQLLGLGTAVTGVEFNVVDPWTADQVARRVGETLGYPYRTDDWQRQNANLFSALKLEKLAMGIILLLIVLVACFNIISTLIMMVADKTREIGILRSMGMTRGSITRIFMYQGVVIGLVGTGLGATLGGGLAWALRRYEFISIPGDVYFVDRLPVQLDLLDVTIIVGASLLISFLATIYPSRRAAALEPVEAIRHE
jgi:lipoprotein-releasing system permease protein